MSRLLIIVAGLLSVAATPAVKETDCLYFAVEVRREGKLVATPHLLGVVDKKVKVERRSPGASSPDYQLVLSPRQLDSRLYQVGLELAFPERQLSQSTLRLAHGEIRKLDIGLRPGELEVSLTLMRVDSPEFRALMRLTELREARGDLGRSI